MKNTFDELEFFMNGSFVITFLSVIVAILSVSDSGSHIVAATIQQTQSPFSELIKLAFFSFGWIIPAFWLDVSISSSGEEVKIARGNTWVDGKYVSIETRYTTGKMTPGDPELAELISLFWLITYPFGYMYISYFYKNNLVITGFKNLDFALIIIIIPIIIITLGFKLVPMLKNTTHPTIIGIIKGWKIAIGICGLNLVFWLTYIIGKWLFLST